MGGGLSKGIKIELSHEYEDIISIENLLFAWDEFVCGKKKKRDVQEFSLQLMDNILTLHEDLRNDSYRHGDYHHFRIADPKPRDIHKASVRDRLVHHTIHRILYPFFDRTFISDSYSCRVNKGTHRALNRFRAFSYIVSKNHTKTCWVLKCDIRKFFASIDHAVLIEILKSYIPDIRIIALLQDIIGSFSSNRSHPEQSEGSHEILPAPTAVGADQNDDKIGLPLGNLTSQLFCNIYMNQFDQFVKHKLKTKHYIRYADDFVILSEHRSYLLELLPHITQFLKERLYLTLHPKKVSISIIASGIDFLGWIHFPDHRVLRTTTKKRMIRRIEEHPTKGTLMSYRGLLTHGNTKKISQAIKL